MRRMALALLLGSAAFPSGVHAQGGGLVVLVVDEQSRPIEGAVVRVSQLSAATNSEGMAHFPGLAPGRWEVVTRFVGYRPDIRDVVVLGREPIRVIVKLDPAPLHLAPVIVEATRPGVYGIVSSHRLLPIDLAEVHLLGIRTRRVLTDTAGRFSHPEARGNYLVRVSAPGYMDRRFSLTVPEGGGREVLATLDPAPLGYQGASNRERMLLNELGRRLAWANPRHILTAATLREHGMKSICEVPEVGSTYRDIERRGGILLMDGEEVVPNLCSIHAHEVEVVEWGSNYCSATSGGLVSVFDARCRRLPQASGQAGRVRARVLRGGPYLVVWLRS